MLRLPPRSPEGEVIGILLTEPQRLATVQSVLQPDDFEDPTAKAAYRAIVDLAQTGHTFDIFAVQSRMPSTEAAEQLWLWKTDAFVANLQAALQDIKERTAWRRCREELLHLLSHYDRLDPRLIPDKLFHAARLLDQVFDPSSAEPPTRRSTGIPQLDRLLGGGWPTDAIIQINGDPGSGRTNLLERLLLAGTPSTHHGLFAVNDSSLAGLSDRMKTHPRISIVPSVTSLAGLVLQSRLRPSSHPFVLVGLDSINGLTGPQPTTTDWRRTVRRLGAPLIVVTAIKDTDSSDFTAAADIVFSISKDRTSSRLQLRRNRFGPANIALNLNEIKPHNG
jgi:hypothetical protein